MAFAAMAGGVCISWMNTVVFNASVRNFSRNRGPVAGLFKACMGLSGAVFSILCSTLFSNLASMYLLMLVTVPNLFCLVSAIFFRPVPTAETQEEEKFERKSIFVYNGIATMLAIYIACLDIISSDVEKSMVYQVATVLILAAIIAAPVFVPVALFLIKREKNVNNEGDDVIESTRKEEEERITYHGKNVQNPGNSTLAIKTMSDNINSNALMKPLLESSQKNLRWRLACRWCCILPSTSTWIVDGLGEETPTLSLFRTWHYYVLYFSLFCGCGSGVAFSNNLGQVGDSLGFDSVNLFVSLFSLGNFFGRIISGNVSEYYIRVAGIPRPAWMGLAKVPMIVLFVCLSTGSTQLLYAGSLVLGFSHGCLVTLTIPIVSEFYGLKHFSTNFVLTITYLVAGSYVFSSMAGYLYDRQAASQGNLTCYGPECFGSTFQILAFFLTVALAFDALLTFISKSLYQNLRVVYTSSENR